MSLTFGGKTILNLGSTFADMCHPRASKKQGLRMTELDKNRKNHG